ncbi:MAG: thermonuclease family protein [Desulfuromonadaceae bacterium]|nr:thermonuclease family protein [Desulfuromonadaceae bacterium]
MQISPGHVRARLRVVLLALLLCALWSAAAWAQQLRGEVSWVYDGDTIKVDGCGVVRLVGVDCPEKKDNCRDQEFIRLGAQSAERLRHSERETLHYLVRTLKGKQVRLELGDPPWDKYGRMLAYVWLENGNMLNRELLRQGRVRVYRYFDFTRKQEFLDLEAEAIRSKRGMWE